MFNGKMKAVTFSFDDGVTQDIRLIEIFNKYGIKCTFNLNSELLGKDGELTYEGKKCTHNKVKPHEVASIYKDHEVAVHTLTHPNLTQIADEKEIIRQARIEARKLVKR
jgi:peptidoglycan/xylan/chitin deacetylase (PgdA/CDA1 family)